MEFQSINSEYATLHFRRIIEIQGDELTKHGPVLCTHNVIKDKTNML